MKKMKSLMLLIATMLMLTVVFCMNASAAEWTKVPFNENAQYTFDEETAVMVIKGEGKLNGNYFSDACPDHYAPEDDVFGCTCSKAFDEAIDPFDTIPPGQGVAIKVKTLIIQEGITAIDVRAFCYFKNLEVAILPQSLTEIPAGAFDGLKKLHTVVLSNSIAKIEHRAFNNCENLRNIYMADTLEKVEKTAFEGCDETVVRIPATAEIYEYTPPKEPWPDVPANVTVVPGTDSITVTWDKVDSNIDGYSVRYHTNVGGDRATIKTTETSCAFENLKSGARYTIYVQAYKKTEKRDYYSDSNRAWTATIPTKPDIVKLTQSANAIKLDWSGIINSERLSGFRLYENVGGKWTVKVNSIAKTSYTFENLKLGSSHTYAIRPYIKTISSGVVWGDYTIVTATTTATTVTSTPPATVTAKATSPTKGKINLTWNNVDSDIDGYRVYYKVGNGAYQIYKNYATAQNLTFSNLKSGTKYTFAVRAGIKTSGGIVWSGYNEAVVTVK